MPAGPPPSTATSYSPYSGTWRAGSSMVLGGKLGFPDNARAIMPWAGDFSYRPKGYVTGRQSSFFEYDAVSPTLCLAARPIGRAFFGERGQAFRGLPGLALGRVHPDEARIGIVVHAHSAERALHRQRLGFGQGVSGVGEQLLDDFCPSGFQIGQRHHLVHETNAASILRAETLTGQRIAADLPHADGVAQLRDDDRGGQPP